jgi:hypothetical protein
VNLLPVTLTGRIVRLEPLGYTHSEGLLKAAAYEEIWTYLGEPTPQTQADAHHLHDPPPGYRPATMPPPKNRQAKARQAQVFVRVLAVTLILLVVVTAVLIVLAIATH